MLVGGGVIRSKGAVPEFRRFFERLNARWPPPSWAAAPVPAATGCSPA